VGLLNLFYATLDRSGSIPIRENQLDKAQNPIRMKSLIIDFALSVLLPGMLDSPPSALTTNPDGTWTSIPVLRTDFQLLTSTLNHPIS
jgi:hypothetical protein